MLFEMKTEAVAFEGLGWTQIDETILTELRGLLSLKAIYARQNLLRGIPDLSFLPSLEILNIANQEEPIDDIDTFCSALRAIRGLKHLSVSLGSEDDEDTIVFEIPGLQSLNGTELTADKAMPPPAPELRPGRVCALVDGEWQVLRMVDTDGTIIETEAMEVDPTPEPTPQPAPQPKEEDVEESDGDYLPDAAEDQAAEDAALSEEYGDMEPSEEGDIGLSDWEEPVPADEHDDLATMAAAADELAEVGRAAPGGPWDVMAPIVQAPTHIGGDGSMGSVLRLQGLLLGRVATLAGHNIAGSTPELGDFLALVGQHVSQLTESFALLTEENALRAEADAKQAEVDINELLKASELLMSEIEGHNTEQRAMREGFEAEKRQLEEELARHKAERDRATTHLRQGVGVDRGSPRRVGTPVQHSTRPPNTRGLKTVSKTVQRGTTDPGQIKAMTVKALKEVIAEVMASKARYDAKAAANRLPPETLREHLYSYLNHRYGLRQLVLDWAESIFRAVRQHEDSDVEVRLFGHILANDVDESFYGVLSDMRRTVVDLLANVLAVKLGGKARDASVISRVEARMAGSVPEDEWVEIVRFMYTEKDSLPLIVSLKGAAAKNPAPAAGKGRARKPQLQFADFMDTLLTYQLHSHDRFLMKFRALFRQFDSDSDGVLSMSEFVPFVSTVSPGLPAGDVQRYAALADPGRTDRVTFSKAVEVLSGLLVGIGHPGDVQ